MATDNFNRANGVLGANWTAHNLGGSSGTGLTIVSNQVKGTDTGAGVDGNIWTAASFGNDQYSEITITSTALTVWVAATVRAVASGPCYTLIYFNNSGTYKLILYYSLAAGSFTVVASGGATLTLPGALVAGDKVRLQVVGSALSCLVNGVEKMSFYDTNIASGGGPGIAIAGNADLVDDWSGGAQAGDFHLVSTDGNGVQSYSQISKYNSGDAGTQSLHKMRVKTPTSPAVGKVHNFLYILAVTAEGLYGVYGDALNTIRTLNAHNTYNLTLIEPSYQIDPWYADHATNPDLRHETFFVNELKSWVTANLATSGTERHWVIGFSKSGFGGIDLMFKHGALFDVGAFWDFPAQDSMNVYTDLGANPAYGTDANFQANYRMTDAFLNANKAGLQTSKKLWLSGYHLYQTDITHFDSKLTSIAVPHTLYAQTDSGVHSWGSGWLPAALAGLDTLSTAMDVPPYPIGLTTQSPGLLGQYQKHFA